MKHMKQKSKIISVLLIIITILNILNISYAGQGDNIIETKEQEKNLKNDNELQNLVNNLKKETNLEASKEQEKNESIIQETEKNELTKKEEIQEEEQNKTIQEDSEENDNVLETVDESQLHIINVNEEGNPIEGNKYTVLKKDNLNSNLVSYRTGLTTNSEGKINVTLCIGKFYLQQTYAVDGYAVNKSLIELNFETGENITLTIKSQKPTLKETNKTLDKQINYTEKNDNVVQNNVTNNSDIIVTNNNKDIINETNTTKWNNVNNIINTIDRTNLLNLIKETSYSNSTQESNSDENIDRYNKVTTGMTTSDFIKYINRITSNSGVPILPVASR